MSLPLFLRPQGSLRDVVVGGRVTLDGPEGRHAVTVRRLGVGERLHLADGAGVLVSGVITQVAAASLILEVETITELPEPNPRFVLVQALAKNDRDDQAIEAATELGVDEVLPWQAERCIVQWRGERGTKARGKWDAVLVAATKQSRRARRPVLGETVTTARLAERMRRAAAGFVLHEEAGEPLAGTALPASGEVLVVVGPEGGIAPAELALLTAAGGRAVRLGDTVLRSSSAGPAALAVLNALSRWR